MINKASEINGFIGMIKYSLLKNTLRRPLLKIRTDSDTNTHRYNDYYLKEKENSSTHRPIRRRNNYELYKESLEKKYQKNSNRENPSLSYPYLSTKSPKYKIVDIGVQEINKPKKCISHTHVKQKKKIENNNQTFITNNDNNKNNNLNITFLPMVSPKYKHFKLVKKYDNELEEQRSLRSIVKSNKERQKQKALRKRNRQYHLCNEQIIIDAWNTEDSSNIF